MPSSVRGKYRRYSALTLGPAAGSYDTEWADAENASPGSPVPVAILAGDQVRFSGVIAFTGANASLDFTLPVGVRPIRAEVLPCTVNDGGVQKGGRMAVAANGVTAITMLDGSAFANGDTVTLSGGYLRA